MTDQERRDDALSEIIFNAYSLIAFADGVQIEHSGMQCLSLNWASREDGGINEATAVASFIQAVLHAEPRFADDISTRIGTLHVCYSDGHLTFVRTLSILPAMRIPVCDWEQILPLLYWLHDQSVTPYQPTITIEGN